MAGLAHAAEAQVSRANEEGERRESLHDEHFGRPEDKIVGEDESQNGELSPLAKSRLHEGMGGEESLAHESRRLAGKTDILNRNDAISSGPLQQMK